MTRGSMPFLTQPSCLSKSLQDNAIEFQQVVNSIHCKEITASIIGFPEMKELKAQVFSETGIE